MAKKSVKQVVEPVFVETPEGIVLANADEINNIPNEEPIVEEKPKLFDDSNKLSKAIAASRKIDEPPTIIMKDPNVPSKPIIEEVYDPMAAIKLKIKNIDIYRVEMNILTGKEAREAIKAGLLVKINEYKYRVKR